MKRLMFIEKITGQGVLSGDSVELARINYEIIVNQWVIRSDSFGGESEGRGVQVKHGRFNFSVRGRRSVERVTEVTHIY
jgi:hypothetical protein